ncbi:hypothetical protein, partial [Mediterranea massiliensis]|uniref:hypothetical protein n=1 Tax=Mediterranea massiliensis TaxID=1841865 RepID=UPI0025A4BC92
YNYLISKYVKFYDSIREMWCHSCLSIVSADVIGLIDRKRYLAHGNYFKIQDYFMIVEEQHRKNTEVGRGERTVGREAVGSQR